MGNPATTDNSNGTEEKPAVKPCCVCKPEKAKRDECLLFHGQESVKCKEIIEGYKHCMRGYGFSV